MELRSKYDVDDYYFIFALVLPSINESNMTSLLLCYIPHLYFVCKHLITFAGEYYGMDHDAYQHEIEEECLEESGHSLPEDKTYESQMTFNPYDLHMGQMTVYR